MNVLVCCDDFLFFFVHNTRRFRPWWSLLCYLAQSGLRVVVCAVVLRGEEKKKLSQDQGALICETLTGSIIASHCPRESGAYCAKQESLQCDWCGLKSLHWDYGDHVRPVGRFLHHSCRLFCERELSDLTTTVVVWTVYVSQSDTDVASELCMSVSAIKQPRLESKRSCLPLPTPTTRLHVISSLCLFWLFDSFYRS